MRNVRYWHLADIRPCPLNVRFWGQSGHALGGVRCLLLTQSGHLVGLGSNSTLLQPYGKLAAQSCYS